MVSFLAFLVLLSGCSGSSKLSSANHLEKVAVETAYSITYRQNLKIKYGELYKDGLLEIRGADARYSYPSYPTAQYLPPIWEEGENVVQEVLLGDPGGMAIYSSLSNGYVLSPNEERCASAACYVRDTIGVNTPQWTLVAGEEMCANRFVCRTATSTWAGREYTAKYLIAYPIGLGPFKFHALPGLVYSVKSADGVVDIELNEIKGLPATSKWDSPNYERAMGEPELRLATYELFLRLQNQGMDFMIADPASDEYIERGRRQYAADFLKQYGGK